jgi:putative membrane protein
MPFTPALITLIVLLIAAVYLRGWLQLRSNFTDMVPAWRAVSFFTGLVLTWVAVASPLALFDLQMLTGHMVQHLLLMTFAPPLIWLGAPVMPLLCGIPRQFVTVVRYSMRWQPARRLGRLLGHPVLCWLAAAAALVLWHVPAMVRLGMQSHVWHLFEHASFVVAGLLFWWPVIQPWPSVARWPRWSMLLYLFLATLPCDVLSALLVFSDRIAYPMYLCMPRHAGLSVLEDQQCAAALMWTCVTVVFLVAGTVLATHLLSPGGDTASQHHGAALRATQDSPAVVGMRLRWLLLPILLLAVQTGAFAGGSTVPTAPSSAMVISYWGYVALLPALLVGIVVEGWLRHKE